MRAVMKGTVAMAMLASSYPAYIVSTVIFWLGRALIVSLVMQVQVHAEAVIRAPFMHPPVRSSASWSYARRCCVARPQQ